VLKFSALWLVLFSLSVNSEPWIKTSEIQLRSDIEVLADIGIIRVPVTSFPLMWAGIIKDIDNTDIQDVPSNYKDAFWRVKRAGKASISDRPLKRLSFSAATGEQVLRSFGDSSRDKAMLTASRSNMSKQFAWNMQVNRVVDPYDGDTLHYDGSYVAGIWGNWVASLGYVEKWWGASWDSANLLSNNARAPLGITLNRNYSDATKLPLLSWLGQWNISGFISRLDDEREIYKPYFSGITLSIKPLDSFEFSFRSVSISEGTTDNLLVDIEPKIITGVDLRWNVSRSIASLGLPTSFYLSATDEEQNSDFSTLQYGLTTSFKIYNKDWRFFVETSRTMPGNSGDDIYNVTYEDDIYKTGYRYNRRSIGSTFDNYSRVTSLGVFGKLSADQSLSIKLQDLLINEGDYSDVQDINHSVSFTPVKIKRLVLNWDYQYDKFNKIKLDIDLSDTVFDSLERLNDKYRMSLNWTRFL